MFCLAKRGRPWTGVRVSWPLTHRFPSLFPLKESESKSRSVVSDSLWPPCTIQPMGFSRPEHEWVAYPFSRGSSPPRDWPRVSCIAGGFFTDWAIREAFASFISAQILPSHSLTPFPSLRLITSRNTSTRLLVYRSCPLPPSQCKLSARKICLLLYPRNLDLPGPSPLPHPMWNVWTRTSEWPGESGSDADSDAREHLWHPYGWSGDPSPWGSVFL